MARSLKVEIIGESKKLVSELRTAQRETETFGTKISGMGKAAALAGGAAGLAILTEGLTESIKAAEQDQQAMAKFGGAVKAVGGALGPWKRALEQAREAGRKLGFTNIETTDAMQKFVSAGENQAQALKDVTFAENLARVSHISLANAALQVNRLHAGGTRLLKQFGIQAASVSTNVDQLKAKYAGLNEKVPPLELAHAKLADKMMAAAKNSELVEARVRGQAQAFSETAAGGMAQFHAQIENIEEAVGNKLLPVLTSLMNWVNDNMPAITAGFSTAFSVISTLVTNLVAPFRVMAALLTGDFSGAWNAIKAPIENAGTAISKIAGLVSGPLTTAWNAISNLAGTVWGAVSGAIDTAFKAIKTSFDTVWLPVRNGLEAGWRALKSAVGSLWGTISSVITGVFEAIKTSYTIQWEVVKTGLTTAWNALQSLASTAWGGIKTAATGALNAIEAAYNKSFKPAISGIKTGLGWIKDHAGEAWDALKGAVQSAAGAIVKALESILGPINDVIGALKSVWDWASNALSKIGDVIAGQSNIPATAPGGRPAGPGGPSGPPPKKRQTGGYLPGPGSQGIPILAHGGEYVIRKSAVDALGTGFLNQLNRYDRGGKINPVTGGPDTPLNRASAIFANDWGEDKWISETATALIGAIGPRAQIRAALRGTKVKTSTGEVGLRPGQFRGSATSGFSGKLMDTWKSLYSNITWEPFQSLMNIGWPGAVSRLPLGGQELGGLLMRANLGDKRAADDLSKITSHAVHAPGAAPTPMAARFIPRGKGGEQYGGGVGSVSGDPRIPMQASGGLFLRDGLVYGHRGETIMPARMAPLAPGGGQELHIYIDGEKVEHVVTARQIRRARYGGPGIPGAVR